MKELEKINRISIASTLFILVVLIGLLTYKRPKNIYAINTHSTLEKLSNDDYFVTINNINNPNYVLIDLRSQYEFEKGHLENAINIYTPEILSETHAAIFKELKETNKTVVLYGNNPQDVNAPFLFLYQMGYDNIKILKAENTYFQNKLVTTNSEVEKTQADITAYIKESVKNAGSNAVIKVIQPVKKTITVRKKKKKPAEGGC
jgi:rhodanese-related sulfurtransferase